MYPWRTQPPAAAACHPGLAVPGSHLCSFRCLWFGLILGKTSHAVTSLCTTVMVVWWMVPQGHQTKLRCGVRACCFLLLLPGFFLSSLCSLVKIFFRLVFFKADRGGGGLGFWFLWGRIARAAWGTSCFCFISELELLLTFLILDRKCALEKEESWSSSCVIMINPIFAIF